ncbi:peptidase [Octadecabacter sp. SW4]|uniref:NlpC/P60 family protein n=1 Tax=Octadecabacter sp. SW4 TaxID=2602067 RepID=UPI0011C20809|nr:NlpC/P60 family protein [Octadecabacter sp. SW4]QEE35881.1 peptidase [Octadecabacter sp. SW4]
MSDAIVKAARSWIGTPYHHQAATRGAGCDCLGLIRGVWAEVIGALPETVPPYVPDWDEPQGREVLLAACRRLLVAKPDAGLGDVIVFRMRAGSVAKHLGIQSQLGSNAAFIHSFQGHGVVESGLTAPWQRRIAARFAFPTRG